MPYVEFIWFQRPLEKLAEHGVTRQEVEQALRRAPAAAVAGSRASGHMTVRWTTDAGRELRIVFDWAGDEQTTAVPVTAYDVE